MKFLKRFPEFRSCATLIQVAFPASDAEQMPAALAVNPYDKESMAYVMHRALTMSLAERQEAAPSV
ncbi:hypothetical protein [Rhodanobacter lindaniclasticus]